MATHYSIPSMLKEAMSEYLVVADFCIKYRKDPVIWGSTGCFGYPAAVLLMVIADAIGSYVIGGSTEKHFEILNHPDYYNLNLTEDDLKKFYYDYRCLLTHNATLSPNVGLSVGEGKKKVIEIIDSKFYINLEPFLNKTKIVAEKFLSEADSIMNGSSQLNKILDA